MGAFEYTALDAGGHERKGLIEGDTAKQVRQLLRDRQLLPLEVHETEQKELKRGQSKSIFTRRVSTLDLAMLTRQLATLLRSGLPLEETLTAVAEQTEKPRIQSIILGVRSKVVEGHPLADGLRDYPQAFPEIYRATVSAGEQSGRLDDVLDRLSDYTESRQVIRQQVTNALACELAQKVENCSFVKSQRFRWTPLGRIQVSGTTTCLSIPRAGAGVAVILETCSNSHPTQVFKLF